jgi:hypothetical protein
LELALVGGNFFRKKISKKSTNLWLADKQPGDELKGSKIDGFLPGIADQVNAEACEPKCSFLNCYPAFSGNYMSLSEILL